MRVILFLTLVIALGFSVSALTQNGVSAAEPSAEGDLVSSARAAAIAMTCANCHGTDGRLQTQIPPLAGKPEMVLRAQLLAFKQDEFPGATVMPRLAKGYSDEELAAVARYFASQPATED